MGPNRQIKFDGFEICEFQDLPDKFPPHSHAHWLVGFLLDGQRHFRCGVTCVELYPYQIITLNPYQIHGCEKSSPDNGRWLCLQLHDSIIAAAFPDRNLRKPIFSSWLKPNLPLAREVSTLVMRKSRIKERLIELLRELAVDNPDKAPETGEHKQKLADFCAIIEQDEDFDLSLEGMAQRLHLNKFSFLRGFKRETGLTPHRYLENLRLLKAAKLLGEGWPVAKTATETGYYDQAHFSKAFKAITGFTPAEARSTGKHACAKGVSK